MFSFAFSPPEVMPTLLQRFWPERILPSPRVRATQFPFARVKNVTRPKQCLTTRHGTQINNLSAAMRLMDVDTVLIDQSCLIHSELKAVEGFGHYAREEVIFFAALVSQHALREQLLAQFPQTTSAEFTADVQLLADDALTLRELSSDRTRSIVVVNGQPIGAIEVTQTVVPEARLLLETIRKLGWRVNLLSDQSEWQTARLASTFAIDHFSSRLDWQAKAAYCDARRATGQVVCFIGDSNSMPLSADLTLSLSPCSTSDVVLKNGALTDLVTHISRRQRRDAIIKWLRSFSIVILVSGLFLVV